MEMKIKSQVQFNDDLSQRSNIVSGDSLSNSFAKIHHDLNDYEIAANIAANDRPKNLLYIHDILSDSVSTATEEILGYPLEAGTYVYSAEIYTVQNPSVANVTKIEFLGSDGNTVVGTCNIACDTKKEEHTNITLSDEAYYIKYYRDTYSSGTVGYLKTSKQMICLPNVYAAFPEYTMYAPSLGETFLEVEDSVKTYDVQDTYDSSSYKAISGKGVAAALGTLDVSSVGGTGKVISAISETDGKISATATTMDTTPTTNSQNPVTSGGVAASQAAQDAEIAVIANAGAKNFLDVQHPTTTTRTSYTSLANGGVELSCSNAAWTSYTIADIPVEAGKEYIITFLLDESSGTSNFHFFLRDSNSSGANLATKNYGSTTGKYETSFTPNNSVIWLGIYINNSATAATATAKLRCMIRPAAITDPTFEPYAKTNRELTVEEQVNENNISILNKYGGGKNKFNIDTAAIYESNASYTKNSDGTINVTKSTNTIGQVSMLQAFLGETGTYIISGCPSGGSSTTYEMLIQSGNTVLARDYGEGASVSLSKGTEYQFKVVVRESQTLSNKLFKPMISVEGGDYQSYALSNPVITPAVIKAVDEGAKNKLPITIQSQTVRTVPFTVNSDGSITANGTVTGGDAYLNLETSIGDKYVGMILSGGTASLKICISKGGSGQIAVLSESSEGVEIPDNATNTLFLFATNGTQLNNVTVKPMICTAADWAVSQKFVPYAKTNPELTAKLMTDEADITSLKHMVDPRSQSQVSSGNLDNVTVSEMRVYSSPSGLPTGVSASSVCIAETCVVDSNSAYQIITLLSNQGTAQNRSYPTYKRVKVGGVWYDWKLIIS